MVRPAAAAAAVLFGLVAGAGAQAPARDDAPRTVYGLELEERGGRERLLIFADRPVVYRLSEPDESRLRLRIPDAVLDATAPPALARRSFQALLSVAASTREGDAGPEVWIEIERASGLSPDISQRGAITAVEFPRVARGSSGISLDFRDAELALVVEAVSAGTGESFVFDDTLVGRVTIAIGERLAPDAARAVLDAALLLAGFAAVPSASGPSRILPVGAAAGAAPWVPELASTGGEAPVVTRLRLREADPEAMLSLLRPLLGSTVLASAHPASNSVILGGPEPRVRRLLWVARSLDVAGREGVRVRRLRHASAEDAARMLQAALAPGPAERERFAVVADARSNALAIRAEPALAARIHELLDRIDVPSETHGVLSVVRVRHADPEALAAVLDALASGATPPDAVAGAGEALRGLDFGVVVDRPTRSLLLHAAPEVSGVLREVIAELDRPPPRIRVEVVVMEVLTSASLELGFDFFTPLTHPKARDDLVATVFANPSGGGLRQPGSGTGPAWSSRFTRAPLVLPIVDANGNPTTLLLPRESAVLTAEEREVYARTLARPQLLMVSGEEHELFSGDNVPLVTAQAGSAGASTGSSALEVRQSVERRDVGLRLRLRPTLGEVGGVRLELDVETSSVVPSTMSAVGPVEEVGPVLRQRHLTATVRLRDGEIAVVGSGSDAIFDRSQVGTPWLQSLPGFGPLFRVTREEPLKRELVIAVQARVLRDPAEDLAESLRRRLAFERAQRRDRPLRDLAPEPYALLVATRTHADDAEQVAERLRAQGFVARVAAWEAVAGPRFDVYATGYTRLADASEAALRLRAAGFSPELAVLPQDSRP